MISILVPLYNEEAILETNVAKLFQFVEEHNLVAELILVSNGSTDRTVEIGNKLAAGQENVKLIDLPERGVGTAFKEGIKAAKHEKVISLDADLSSDLNFILHATGLLDSCDMVVGSKSLGRQRRNLVRVAGSQLYILLTNLLFQMTISDYSIGCKAMKRSVILPILEHLSDWTGYVLEICLYLHKNNNKVIQIGVNCDDRRKSHFNICHEGFYRYYHLYRCWRDFLK